MISILLGIGIGLFISGSIFLITRHMVLKYSPKYYIRDKKMIGVFKYPLLKTKDLCFTYDVFWYYVINNCVFLFETDGDVLKISSEKVLENVKLAVRGVIFTGHIDKDRYNRDRLLIDNLIKEGGVC